MKIFDFLTEDEDDWFNPVPDFDKPKKGQAEPVKPVSIPAVPKLPAKDGGDLGADGYEVVTLKDGTRAHKSNKGTFVYDKSGTPITYRSINMNGVHQVHDLKTGNFVQQYENGGFVVDQEYDKTGKPIGRAGKRFRFGDIDMSIDRKGNKTVSYQQGPVKTTSTSSSLKDRWGNPVTSGDGDVVGTTAQDKTTFNFGKTDKGWINPEVTPKELVKLKKDDEMRKKDKNHYPKFTIDFLRSKGVTDAQLGQLDSTGDLFDRDGNPIKKTASTRG